MRKIKIVLGLAVLAGAFSVGWQVAACELASIELQDDINDLTSQLGARVGYSAPNSDEDFRNAVLRSAHRYGIKLMPGQVSIQREGSGPLSTVHLSADYTAPIHLFRFSFSIHFTPESGKKTF